MKKYKTTDEVGIARGVYDDATKDILCIMPIRWLELVVSGWISYSIDYVVKVDAGECSRGGLEERGNVAR